MRKIFWKSLIYFCTTFLSLLFTSLFASFANANYTISPWNPTTPTLYTIANQVAFQAGNKIFILGGSTSEAIQNISYASVKDDGSLDPWQYSSVTYPFPIYWQTHTKFNDYFYSFGGTTYPPPNSVDNVYVGQINSEGNLVQLSSANPLPERLSLGTAVAIGNWIYFMGGATWTNGGDPTMSDDIYVSTINEDGTLGVWQSANLKLPTPLATHSVITQGNKIIVIGGTTSASFSGTNKVYVYQVDTLTGDLTRLPDYPDLSFYTRSAMVTKIGGFVIHVGGIVDSVWSDEVYFTTIDASGNLGGWQLSSELLPQALCCTAIASWGDYIYILGGHISGFPYYIDTVYYAKISPTSSFLSVPDIKQYSPPWNDDEYDWASHWWPSNPTIDLWGCALTSASMVLNYHHHNILPDALNEWLKNQSDGFSPNGGVMFTAISRYTKNHESEISPALEFRYHNPDTNLLSSEIDSKRPPILKFQKYSPKIKDYLTHFVVAKGKEGIDFAINDPASPTNRLMSQVAENRGGLVKIGVFTSSQTDLSYIVLFINEDFNIEVFDPDGNRVDEGYLKEGPIVDATDDDFVLGETLNAFYLPKPKNGIYKVEITGPSGNYLLNSYIYDKQAEVNTSNYEGYLSEGEKDVFLINLDKEDVQNSNISEVTFASLLKDLDNGFNQGKINNRAFYKGLRSLISYAERLYEMRYAKYSKKLLNLTLRYVRNYSPRLIDKDFSIYLQTKIKILRSSL